MINLFKKNNKKYKKIIHKARLMNAGKHWIILVKAFIIMAIGLIVFSLYLLFKVRSDNSFQSNIDRSRATPVFIQEDLLEKVRHSIKEKESQNKAFETGIIYFVDPS